MACPITYDGHNDRLATPLSTFTKASTVITHQSRQWVDGSWVTKIGWVTWVMAMSLSVDP